MPTLGTELVPSTEWRFFSRVARGKASAPEAALFYEKVEQIAGEGTGAPVAGGGKAIDPNAPKGTTRATITLSVSPTTGDLLHNGRDGLRARYWISPKDGEYATSRLIELCRRCFCRHCRAK